MKLKDKHRAFLERTARELSRRTKTNVTPRHVLEAILDMAILDEGVYDPDFPEEPMSPTRRAIVQSERRGRTVSLELHELLQIVRECSVSDPHPTD